MVNVLTHTTPHHQLPTYLIIVSSKKLEKYLHSKFRWWKRYLLESNDIWLMDESLNKDGLLFFNNDKKYDTVYKKWKINQKVLYIPIEEFSKFYLDHKIKISTSIVEMQGVFSIHYIYSELATELITSDSNAEYATARIENKVSNDKKNAIRNNDLKKYDKSDCPFLFYTPEHFEEEIKKSNEYFMDWGEYITDFDLKNLVRSRLIGNLTEYTLKYEIDFMNNFEIGLTSKFYAGFGLSFKKNYHKKLNVSLNIKFFRNRDLINSDNMCIDDNRCLQLILKGPSPPNYYDAVGKTKTPEEEMIGSPPISPCKSNDCEFNSLLLNFIDKFIEEKYKQKTDTDDFKSYYSFYHFIKIAKPQLLHEYVKDVRNLDDLDKNGVFFLRLRSTAFASLVPFNDTGLSKIQKIYLNIFRQFPCIQKYRCEHDVCPSTSSLLLRIYTYIIRAFNNSHPDAIITVDNTIPESLEKILHNIAINLVIFPTYAIFEGYVIKEINKYKSDLTMLLM